MTFWGPLGIEATPDVTVIKKAYAEKLRLTHPDDAAAAYQALREAFQAALAYAKAAAAPATRTAAAPATSTDAWPRDKLDPDAVVASVEHLWRGEGDEALLAYWPSLRDILNEASIALSYKMSAAFARLVLKQRQLPIEFVDQLRRHFEWGSDFKRAPAMSPSETVAFSARLVGLAFEMQTLIANRKYERLNLEQAAAAAALAEEARRTALFVGSRLLTGFARTLQRDLARAIAVAALAGPPLQDRWEALTPQDRGLLELDDSLLENGRAAIDDGLRTRVMLGLLGAAALAHMLAHPTVLSAALLLLPVLSACWFLPVAEWNDAMAGRFFPHKFAHAYLMPYFSDGSHSVCSGSSTRAWRTRSLSHKQVRCLGCRIVFKAPLRL